MIRRFARVTDRHPTWIYAIIVALLLPALLLHLGTLPLFADEGIRALVAIEMMITGEYVVPHTFGELYYNKPPLYNWVIIASYKLTGSTNEFALRLPSILALFGFGLTIFLWLKPRLGLRTAFFSAIFFITCGRMLSYSSLLGHIDIFYSWVTFLGFIGLYSFHRRGNLWLAFGSIYLTAALGVLMKGLPSFAFLGITLLVYFSYSRQFWKLFHPAHFLALAGFFGILAAYFLAYESRSELVPLLEKLFTESSQRTVAERPISHTLWWIGLGFLLHLCLQFMPWILVLLISRYKGWFRQLWANPVLKFALLVFAFNAVIYWLSPGTRPRYMFPIYPFLATLLAWTYLRYQRNRYRRGFQLVAVLTAFAALGTLFPFYDGMQSHPILVHYPGLKLLSLVVCFCLLLSAIMLYHSRKQSLAWVVVAMLFLRIGFNAQVIPTRAMEPGSASEKTIGLALADLPGKEQVLQYNFPPIGHATAFYYTQQTGKVLGRQRGGRPQVGAVYLFQHGAITDTPMDTLNVFQSNWKNTEMVLARILE